MCRIMNQISGPEPIFDVWELWIVTMVDAVGIQGLSAGIELVGFPQLSRLTLLPRLTGPRYCPLVLFNSCIGNIVSKGYTWAQEA